MPSSNGTVRVAIIGVGNCANSLLQGVEYYKDADPEQFVPGLMHVDLGGYHVRDVEFTAAFDVTTTKVGTNLKGDELIGVPNSTDVWGALSEAPGVRMQGFDVGGSHKSQQSAYEVFGVQNQSRVVTESIDHTEGVGGTGFYEDYFANEEYSISALGTNVAGAVAPNAAAFRRGAAPGRDGAADRPGYHSPSTSGPAPLA